MSKKIFMALSMIVVFAVASSVVYGCGRGNGRYHNNGGGHGNGGYHNNGGGRGNDSYDRNGGHMGYNNGSYGHMGYNNGSSSYNNMTVEEKTKYDALYNEYTPKMDTLRDKMVDQRSIINTEYSKTNPDLATINKAIDKSSEFSAEMRKLRVAYSIEMQKLFPRNNNRNRY